MTESGPTESGPHAATGSTHFRSHQPGGAYILLTGSTGLLGRYLVRDLLLRGERLAVLARPARAASAAERIETLLVHWEHDLGQRLPRPVVLEGDVTRTGLGMGAESCGWAAAHCSLVLHGAASLTFHGSDRSGEPWRSNLGGVRNVAQWCRGVGVRNLHHVSTAYVCGTRAGLIREDDLDLGQGFRNDYEESKLTAEAWLRAESGLDVTIYRPAVIVGDWHTGYTSTYHGLYRFFQFTALLRGQAEIDADGRWHHPVRLCLSGSERRNLVPVDWVSKAIAELVSRPECHGATYHLAPEQPTSSAEVEAALADYFGYYGVSFVGPDGLTTAAMTDYERGFYQYINTHEAYLTTEPQFDLTKTRGALPHNPCPPVDVDCLRRLIDFGVHDRWGKARRRPVARPAVSHQPHLTPAVK